MKELYLPVVKAKKGEFTAIRNLSQEVHKRILPLFEVTPLLDQQLKAKKRQTMMTPQRTNLIEVANEIAGIQGSKRFAVDISYWPSNGNVETGEHVLTCLLRTLHAKNAGVCPAVKFDHMDDPEYRAALTGIELERNCFFIMRLGSTAIEDIKDPDYLEEQLDLITETLGVGPDRIVVTLDFGDITSSAVVDVQQRVDDALADLAGWDFRRVAILGSSVPASINEAVESIDSVGELLRKEMTVWWAVRHADPPGDLLFGDYGVRCPHSMDAPSPNANGKIRYTTHQKYFIARGHALRIGNKGAQYFELADAVVNSGHFRGRGFSWGDGRIEDCYSLEFKGNATDWIAIDTNHHIHSVVEEVASVERQIVAKASARISENT